MGQSLPEDEPAQSLLFTQRLPTHNLPSVLTRLGGVSLLFHLCPCPLSDLYLRAPSVCRELWSEENLCLGRGAT